jgi:hypothetical protein
MVHVDGDGEDDSDDEMYLWDESFLISHGITIFLGIKSLITWGTKDLVH